MSLLNTLLSFKSRTSHFCLIFSTFGIWRVLANRYLKKTVSAYHPCTTKNSECFCMIQGSMFCAVFRILFLKVLYNFPNYIQNKSDSRAYKPQWTCHVARVLSGWTPELEGGMVAAVCDTLFGLGLSSSASLAEHDSRQLQRPARATTTKKVASPYGDTVTERDQAERGQTATAKNCHCIN